MNSKKKLAAVGLAAVIGAAGYGVYATTLNVTNASTSFAAGAATQGQVEGFGTVTIDAGKPVYDPSTGLFEFKDLAITPGKESDWANVKGKTIEVVGYNKDGKEVVNGSLTAPEKGVAEVPLSAGDANAIVNWGIVIQ